MTEVAGYCPACGHAGLFLAEGGYITCPAERCPEPDAVSTLLEDRETEHIVTFTRHAWTIRHPLRERLRDELMTCALHQACRAPTGPPAGVPVAPGRYRARREVGGWSWERLAQDSGEPP